jgi:hypothetical protein
MCRSGSSICESALKATSSEGATTTVLREQSGLLVLGYRAGLSVPRSKLWAASTSPTSIHWQFFRRCRPAARHRALPRPRPAGLPCYCVQPLGRPTASASVTASETAQRSSLAVRRGARPSSSCTAGAALPRRCTHAPGVYARAETGECGHAAALCAILCGLRV